MQATCLLQLQQGLCGQRCGPTGEKHSGWPDGWFPHYCNIGVLMIPRMASPAKNYMIGTHTLHVRQRPFFLSPYLSMAWPKTGGVGGKGTGLSMNNQILVSSKWINYGHWVAPKILLGTDQSAHFSRILRGWGSRLFLHREDHTVWDKERSLGSCLEDENSSLARTSSHWSRMSHSPRGLRLFLCSQKGGGKPVGPEIPSSSPIQCV